MARDVRVPADAVWEPLATFDAWPRWGLTVTAVRAEAESVEAGLHGRVRTPVGVWLPFEITEVDPGRSWTWKVADIEATGHCVTPTGASTSRIEFTAPRWAAPYVPVLRAGVRRLAMVAEAAQGPVRTSGIPFSDEPSRTTNEPGAPT